MEGLLELEIPDRKPLRHDELVELAQGYRDCVARNDLVFYDIFGSIRVARDMLRERCELDPQSNNVELDLRIAGILTGVLKLPRRAEFRAQEAMTEIERKSRGR